MKILLFSGHGANDSGAIGNGTNERKETRRVTKELKRYLDSLKISGLVVDIYNTERDAFSDLSNSVLSISSYYDYVLEIHFNSFNKTAYGTECYVTTTETGITVEQEILKNLSSYFFNRGVKRTNYGVIWYAKSKGISSALLEVCFIDNASDMKTYNNHFASVCKAIGDGVVTGFGLKGNTSNGNTYHTVVKGDTLYSLSKKYNTTVDKIKQLNGKKNNTIFVGEKLRVK